MPYALVPTPDEYGLGGFERRLPRDAFACVALIELQAYVHLGKSSLFIRHCEAIASVGCRARMARQAVKVLNPILKKSLNLFSKTEEATTGGKWAAGLRATAPPIRRWTRCWPERKVSRRAAFPSRDPSPFLTRVNSRTPRRQRLLDLLASVLQNASAHPRLIVSAPRRGTLCHREPTRAALRQPKSQRYAAQAARDLARPSAAERTIRLTTIHARERFC